MKELHADAAIGTVGGLRPPRAAVVAPVGGERAVHVVGDPLHRLGIEPALQMSEAGLGDEVRDVGVVGVGRERAVQIEGCAETIGELDAARGVRGAPVDERSQHHPPVEEVAQVAPRDRERTGGHVRHRSLEVVDDVGDIVVGQAHAGGTRVAGRHRERVAVERERPAATRRLDRERLDAELTSTRERERGALVDEPGELRFEERSGRDRPDVVVGSGAEVERDQRDLQARRTAQRARRERARAPAVQRSSRRITRLPRSQLM